VAAAGVTLAVNVTLPADVGVDAVSVVVVAVSAAATVIETALDVLDALFVSPPYVAVSEKVPAVLKVVVSVAVPADIVPVPSDVVPLKKVTVPVAVEGDNVAVSVTLAPTVGVVVDGVSVTVLTVVPVGACQKSPHPARNGTTATAKRSKIHPLLPGLDIMGGHLLCVCAASTGRTHR
jgi:hypothetical protein